MLGLSFALKTHLSFGLRFPHTKNLFKNGQSRHVPESKRNLDPIFKPKLKPKTFILIWVPGGTEDHHQRPRPHSAHVPRLRGRRQDGQRLHRQVQGGRYRDYLPLGTSYRVYQGSAKEWSLGCVIPAYWPPLAAGARFTQPRAHSLADPCKSCPFSVLTLQPVPSWVSCQVS